MASLYQRHAATPKGLTEVGRTMRSKTFDLGERKRKLVQTVGPLHWPDGQAWRDIDLQPVEQPDGMLRVDQAAYKLIVDPTTAWLRHESRETGLRARVGLKVIGGAPVTLPAPVVEDGRILWPEVVPDVDIELVFRPKGAEWFKIIKSPTAPHDFTWSVERQAGFPASRIKMQTAGRDASKDKLRMSHVQSNQREENGWVKLDQTERFERQVSRIVDKRTRRRDWFNDPQYPVRVDQDITEQISAGIDDVNSTAGTFLTTRGIMLIGLSSEAFAYNGGFRFQTIAVPQGVTIDQALLKLFATAAGGVTQGLIWGDDVDDAPQWSNSTPNRPFGVTKTTASAAFDVTQGTGQFTQQNVTAIVQEIVDRAGWASGQDMRFAVLPATMGSSGFLSVVGYEAGGTDEALLEIDYTAAGLAIPIAYHHYRTMQA